MGKNSQQQNLGSPHSGTMSTLTTGDTLSRMMGQYKKGHSFAAPGPKASKVPMRGGAGGIRRNPTKGGIGPGKMGTTGPASGSSTDYPSMTSETE